MHVSNHPQLDTNPGDGIARLLTMGCMGGQYSIDVAGFLSTTDTVATALESMGQAVSGGLSDLDRIAGLIAGEGDLASALDGATEERRRTGPGAVEHGGSVVTAAGRVALAYVQADDEMASTTSGADASTGIPRVPDAGRRAALVQ